MKQQDLSRFTKPQICRNLKPHFLLTELNKKTDWSPSIIPFQTPTELTAQRYGVIQRCIALALVLEIPVGDYALEGILELDDPLFELALQSNAYDEVIHLKAFQEAAKAYGVKEELVKEAEQICNAFLSIDAHPVYAAGYLELSLFFVTLTMLRKFGASLIKTLSRDVSRDESVHVKTNWHIIDEMGLGTSSLVDRQLNKNRHDTVAWLVGNLQDKRFGLKYWINQSDQLIQTRQAEGLEWTAAAVMPAFFEMEPLSKY